MKCDLKTRFSTSLLGINVLLLDSLLFPKDTQNVPSATKFLVTFIDAIRKARVEIFPYRLLSVNNYLFC